MRWGYSIFLVYISATFWNTSLGVSRWKNNVAAALWTISPYVSHRYFWPGAPHQGLHRRLLEVLGFDQIEVGWAVSKVWPFLYLFRPFRFPLALNSYKETHQSATICRSLVPNLLSSFSDGSSSSFHVRSFYNQPLDFFLISYRSILICRFTPNTYLQGKSPYNTWPTTPPIKFRPVPERLWIHLVDRPNDQHLYLSETTCTTTEYQEPWEPRCREETEETENALHISLHEMNE